MISIVIPVYNGAEYIAETIENCLAQTFKDVEIVVVDDCSTDGTADIVNRSFSEYRNVTCIRNDKNRGLSASRNVGIRQSHGELIQFLDHDDLIAPDRFEILLKGLVENYKFDGGIISNYAIFDNEEGFEAGILSKRDVENLSEMIFDRDIICPIHSVLFSRESVESVGGFRESLRQCEDRDILYRISKNGFRFGYSERILSFYRIVQGSMSKSHFNNAVQMIALLRECGELTVSRLANAVTPYFRQEKREKGVCSLLSANGEIRKWCGDNSVQYNVALLTLVILINRLKNKWRKGRHKKERLAELEYAKRNLLKK